jgi:hypothetical protein
MEIALLVLVFLTWAAFCVAATRAVVRDDLSDRRQKFMQIALVWVLPVIGSLVVLAVHRKADPPSGKYYEAADPGDDFARSGQNLNLPSSPDVTVADQE